MPYVVDISQELEDIKLTPYGKTMRPALHSSIEKLSRKQNQMAGVFDQLIINAGASNAEVVAARVEEDGTPHNMLGDRLNSADAKFNALNREVIAARTDKNNVQYNTLKDRLDAIDSQIDSIAINVNRFGAVGDGIADDTLAIQNAVDFAKDNNCKLVLNGEYLISDTINVYSNTVIEGIGRSKINLGGKVWDKPVFNLKGSVIEEIKLAQNTTIGDDFIHLDNAINVLDNSYIIINSQRSAFGDDAGEFYKLGTSTATTVDCYFGEFLRVRNKEANKVNLYDGLIFGGYKFDKSGETDLNAKEFSFIERVEFVENVRIENIEFYNGSCNVNSNVNIINADYCLNSIFKDITYRCDLVGGFIGILNSYNVKADGCKCYYTSLDVNDHYDQNAYKTLSSQKCGFVNCFCENGQQPFDLTYVGGRMPSLDCFVDSCVASSARYTGMTTHPGTYLCSVINNNFRSHGDGIAIRGQSHTVLNNIVNSISKTESYGIGLIEGYGNNIIVSNNTINGFDFGVRVHESYSNARDTSYNNSLRILIDGNNITQSRVAFYIDRASDSTRNDVSANLLITNNQVSNFRNFSGLTLKACICISGDSTKSIKHIYIKNNIFNLSSSIEADIPTVLFRCDCNATVDLIDNIFTDVRDRSYLIYGTTNGRILNIIFKNNKINMLSGDYFISSVSGLPSININSDFFVNIRPTRPIRSNIPLFDTNLGKPIWYNGTNWVDSNGIVV